MSGEPEALRLADRLGMLSSLFVTYGPEKGERLCANAAAELRRQHAEIERLRNTLHRISLASQNSMSSKGECGQIARAGLEGKP